MTNYPTDYLYETRIDVRSSHEIMENYHERILFYDKFHTKKKQDKSRINISKSYHQDEKVLKEC